MAVKAKAPKETLGFHKTEQTYGGLKDRIFSGFYLPRQHLVESVLSEDLGINRMTVREMLERLVLEGLIVKQPYKGCRVADISIQNTFEIYQVEAALEGFAAFLAADRISDRECKKLEYLVKESIKLNPKEVENWQRYNQKIHRVINRACGNTHLINIIKNNVIFSKYWFINLSTPGEIPKKNQEHELILKAIKEKNTVNARQLVENHIMKSAESIRSRLLEVFPIFNNGKQTGG